MIIGKIKIVFSHRNRIAQSDSLKKPIDIPVREVSLTKMYLRLYLCPPSVKSIRDFSRSTFVEVYQGLVGLLPIY